LVGLGINVNVTLDSFPEELRGQVTSLQEELDGEIDRITFTQQLFKEFEREYLSFSTNPNENIPKTLKTWRLYSDTLGRNVKVESTAGEITGMAADITENGELLVITETGEEHRIIAGDCIYIEQ
jgi:BirA family biotin operon repressor/biotin-[acetyl-CoA-carboxylase] ligase